MSSENEKAENPLFEKLSENMQVIYRKAIDADDALTKIQQTGKGKFQHVFPEDAGFSVQSKRFMPYVKELASQIAELESAPDNLEIQLPNIVKKMELLLTTLAQFRGAINT